MPPAYFERLQKLMPEHPAATAFPRLRTLWDLDARRKLLDGFGDYRQVLSPAHPPLRQPAGVADAAELARIANDGLAELTRHHPDRFPTFIASLPMNDVDASLREIDRAVGDLGARGVQVFTNVLGAPLSDKRYRPVFARMVAHDLPVWVHPMRGPQF